LGIANCCTVATFYIAEADLTVAAKHGQAYKQNQGLKTFPHFLALK
jgi:hypothetical protein